MNIHSLPEFDPLSDEFSLPILLKMDDSISTDGILLAGAKALPYRLNLERIATFSFARIEPSFAQCAGAEGGKIRRHRRTILCQGSSREHAAATPRYLRLRSVIAKSFARIPRQKLTSYGVVPLRFVDPANYTVDQSTPAFRL